MKKYLSLSHAAAFIGPLSMLRVKVEYETTVGMPIIPNFDYLNSTATTITTLSLSCFKYHDITITSGPDEG